MYLHLTLYSICTSKLESLSKGLHRSYTHETPYEISKRIFFLFIVRQIFTLFSSKVFILLNKVYRLKLDSTTTTLTIYNKNSHILPNSI